MKMEKPDKIYDQEIKSYIYQTLSLIMPAKNNLELGLDQSFLVFQLQFVQEVPINLEVAVKTMDGKKIRLLFASAFREFSSSTFHIKIPIDKSIPRDNWLNICIDIDSFLEVDGMKMSYISSINMRGYTKIRKVFTSKYPLSYYGIEQHGESMDDIDDSYGDKRKILLPKAVNLMAETYNIDFDYTFMTNMINNAEKHAQTTSKQSTKMNTIESGRKDGKNSFGFPKNSNDRLSKSPSGSKNTTATNKYSHVRSKVSETLKSTGTSSLTSKKPSSLVARNKSKPKAVQDSESQDENEMASISKQKLMLKQAQKDRLEREKAMKASFKPPKSKATPKKSGVNVSKNNINDQEERIIDDDMFVIKNSKKLVIEPQTNNKKPPKMPVAVQKKKEQIPSFKQYQNELHLNSHNGDEGDEAEYKQHTQDDYDENYDEYNEDDFYPQGERCTNETEMKSGTLNGKFNSTGQYQISDDEDEGKYMIEEDNNNAFDRFESSKHNNSNVNDMMNATQKLDKFKRKDTHTKKYEQDFEKAAMFNVETPNNIFRDFDLNDSLEDHNDGYNKGKKKNLGHPVKDLANFVDEIIGDSDGHIRPFSPPASNFVNLIDPNKTVVTKSKNKTVVMNYSTKNGEKKELEYDPILNCYVDPDTNVYYPAS